ncbi:NADP-dependent oxidoreductase [Micromonospora sp. LH3U1]|nr:NADP-dependent oxidoreductase [Micromonospora sp. LH3U1]WCN84144.1 NADP-dependent oxidoreductase [Micromonospora sp. LH3U1]
MRAVIVRRFGGPEVLEIVDLPEPEPGVGQLRVRVVAAAVNRIDLSTRSGALSAAGLLPPLPVVGLGWDVAGEVDAVGPGVRRFAVGDQVIGLRDLLSAPGAQAEWVVLDEGAVALAPRTVAPELAATLPLIGLTAARSLALTGLDAGRTLLVTGGAGGVGGLLLELAALRGIRTVAVADARDEELVRSLGANWFVARTDRVGAAVRAVVPGGVDAVVDAAVIGVAAHEALRGGAVFVALVAPFAPPRCAPPGSSCRRSMPTARSWLSCRRWSTAASSACGWPDGCRWPRWRRHMSGWPAGVCGGAWCWSPEACRRVDQTHVLTDADWSG